MNKNLAYDFSVDKENNTIRIKREFAAELPLVWDAYTKHEILDQWWAPKPWRAKTKSMEFKEGGRWHYAMVGPEGEEHWAMANYIAIKPKTTFTAVDAFTDAEGKLNADLPRAKWHVTFTDKGEMTVVDIHISFDDLAQLEATLEMGFKEGMTVAMEGLDELLASMKTA